MASATGDPATLGIVLQLTAILIAAGGLYFVGSQTKRGNLIQERQSYLASLDRYLQLKQAILDKPDLNFYAIDPKTTPLNDAQLHYIFKIIAFCEGLWLTDQIDAFPSIPGGSWANYIKSVFECPSVRSVWDRERSDAKACPYATGFVQYVTSLQGAH